MVKGNGFASLLLFLLVVIHTLDMELTTHYIGDSWRDETFLPMRECIRMIGIYNACWVSRICTYTYIFLTLLFWDRRWVRCLLFVVTTAYWAAMVSWLFTLNIVRWP
jgi:hypothetical protein